MGMNNTTKIGVLGVIILVILGIAPVMAATPIYNPQVIGVQPPGSPGCASPPPNWHPGMPPIYIPMYCWVKLPTGLTNQIMNAVQNALKNHITPLYWSPGTGVVGLRGNNVVTIPTVSSNPMGVLTNALHQLQSYSASLMNNLATMSSITWPTPGAVQDYVSLGNAIFIPASYTEKDYNLNHESTQYLGSTGPVNTPSSPAQASLPQSSTPQSTAVHVPTTAPTYAPPKITLPTQPPTSSNYPIPIPVTGIKPPKVCPLVGGVCSGPPMVPLPPGFASQLLGVVHNALAGIANTYTSASGLFGLLHKP